MQRKRSLRNQLPLEQRLTTHYEETMAELRALGSTEALLSLAQNLQADTRRDRYRELLFAIAISVAVALRLLDKISTLLLICSFGLIVGIIYWPARIGSNRRLNTHRTVLLKASIELLESHSRTDLPALLILLQALEAQRPDSSDTERLVYHGAIRILSKHLATTPGAELRQLPKSSRTFLVRELGRATRHAYYKDPVLNRELPICLFLALTELKQPGAKGIAEFILALSDTDECLREAAQEYLTALRA